MRWNFRCIRMFCSYIFSVSFS